MQLRRFTAETTPAALGAVRMALGDEAIILSNRRLGDLVEIIATGHMDDATTMSDMSIEGIEEELRSTTDALSDSIEVSETHKDETKPQAKTAETLREDTPKPSAEGVAESPESSAIEESIRIDKSAVTQVEEPSVYHRKFDAANSLDAIVSSSTDRLMAALNQQATKMEEQFRGLTVNLWGSNCSHQSEHLKKLLSLGIGTELAVKLVEQVPADASLDAALRQSYANLKALLPISTDNTSFVPGVTIVSGAPGSGKTTTLVKLAAEHVKLRGNQSIIFICSNTRRIGAFEELEAYGRLMGVPTVHAHDSNELAGLTEAFKHKQLVLVDHTLPNDEESLNLPECLSKPKSSDSIRHLFVLSATSQTNTVDYLISAHCTVKNVSCVLTHLDSNARLGETLSAVIRHQLPISYWSDSASVQEPLQKAKASVIVATAVAMANRIPLTVDDVLLQRLIQPSQAVLSSYEAMNPSSKSREDL